MENTAKRVLALIRHGAYAQPPGVPSAHLPYALTAEGRAQAAEAALGIARFAESEGLELDEVIDCSHMRRAWETADVIGAALASRTGQRFVCREFDALAERGVGAAANLSVDAIEALLRDDPRFDVPPRGWKRDAQYRLPFQGAESLAEAGERVARHLAACGRALPGRSSLKLVVGHGGAFRHAASALGALAPEQVSELSLQYCAPIYFEYQSGSPGLGRLVHKAGNWTPRSERTASSVALD
jgi:broad specificity phosphatase PhoE